MTYVSQITMLWQKPLQYCKVISLQLIKKINKVKNITMLYILSLYSVVCQLYLNKTGKEDNITYQNLWDTL